MFVEDLLGVGVSVSKYKLIFLFFVLVSACHSGQKIGMEQTETMLVGQGLQMDFPSGGYQGSGLTHGEEGPDFHLERKDGGIKFFVEELPEGMSQIRPHESQKEWKLEGFEQCELIQEKVLFCYNSSTGFKDLTSNGAICFNFEGDFDVLLYVAYRAELHHEVLKIARSLSRVK